MSFFSDILKKAGNTITGMQPSGAVLTPLAQKQIAAKKKAGTLRTPDVPKEQNFFIRTAASIPQAVKVISENVGSFFSNVMAEHQEQNKTILKAGAKGGEIATNLLPEVTQRRVGAITSSIGSGSFKPIREEFDRSVDEIKQKQALYRQEKKEYSDKMIAKGMKPGSFVPVSKTQMRDVQNAVMGFIGGTGELTKAQGDLVNEAIKRGVRGGALESLTKKVISGAVGNMSQLDNELADRSVNLNNFNIPNEAKNRISKTIQDIKPKLEEVRGKPLTNAEVIEAAEQSQILTKATSREATLKSEAAILKTRQHLAAMAQDETVTKEFIDTLRVVSEEATKRGRELQALGIAADPSLATPKAQIIKKLLELGQSSDEILKAAEGVDFNNRLQATEFYRKFIKPTVPELLDEYRYINMLSSPKTHIVNTFSNLLQSGILDPATKLVTGGLDAVSSALTGEERKAYVSEVPAYYRGFFNSIDDAVKGFSDSFMGRSTMGRPDVERLPTGNKALKVFDFIPRLLEASDIFFRTLVTGGEKEALALRAQKGGQELTEDILMDIEAQAAEKANYYVFRKALDPSNKTGQGVLLSGIDKMTSAIYGLRKVPGVKWFVPFVQTPMNILKQGIEYSPLGVTTIPGAANKTEQLAKSIIGSVVTLGAGQLALKDRTTWTAPTDDKEKAAFYAAGRQPYSIKIGDKWYAYSKLGPLAYPIAMASAVKWYFRENPKAVTETGMKKITDVLGGIGQFFADQSYVQGMNNLLQTLSGDAQSIKDAVTNMPQQLIPLSSLIRWVNTGFLDPVFRQPESGLSMKSIWQNIEKGLPVISKNVPAIPNPEGKPEMRPYPKTNAFSPIGVSKESPKFEQMYQDTLDIKEIQALGNKRQDELKKQAEDILAKVRATSSVAERQAIISPLAQNPDLMSMFKAVVKNAAAGTDFIENQIKGLSAKDRATYILQKLNTLPADERYVLISNLQAKKILTKQVRDEMALQMTKSK